MPAETFRSKLYVQVCCFVLFFVTAAASFSGFYAKWHFNEADVPGDNSAASFESMVDGTAQRPVIYRRMIPAVDNFADRVTPAAAKKWLYDHRGDGEDAELYAMSASATANDPVYFYRYLVQYLVTFFFALLSAYALYFMAKAAGIPPPAALCSSVIFMLLFPYFLTGGGYAYDYSELAFFALAFLIACKHDWWLLIPLAMLGEWNKETYLLFVITLYPILRNRISRTRATAAVGTLCLICIAVFLPALLHYTHSPGGGGGGWHDQLQALVHPSTMLFATEETYGVRMLKMSTLLPMLLIVWTAVRGWKHLPHAMQRHAQIAAVLNLPLYLFFCAQGELRDLSLLYITFLLMLAGNLNEWIQAA